MYAALESGNESFHTRPVTSAKARRGFAKSNWTPQSVFLRSAEEEVGTHTQTYQHTYDLHAAPVAQKK